MTENGEWVEYRRLVMNSLERLDEKVVQLNATQDLIRLDIVRLKTKASMWGGLAGAVAAIIGSLASSFMI